MQKPISAFWWFWIPVLLMVFQIIIELSFSTDMLDAIHSEGGPHEMLEAVFIGAAFCVGLYTLTKLRWHRDKWLMMWIGLATLCSFYVAGEEISWGQHIFDWSTPEFWAQVNDQDETNLHNTSAWLDQKPRALLFIGIVIGGLIIPALRRWKPEWLPAKFEKIYPVNQMVPTALGVLVPYLCQSAARHIFHVHLFERESEVQELYMFYFVLLYLLYFYKREISQL